LVTRTAGSALTCGITLSAGDRFLAISTWRVGTEHSIWLNGRDGGTESTADTSTSGTGSLGNLHTFQGSMAIILNRYISLNEAMDWYTDPYAIVRLRRRVTGRAPAAAGPDQDLTWQSSEVHLPREEQIEVMSY
ncbi:hypothetical protein LCGC14_1294430, partial [marine sediment metagenome]